MKTLCVRIQLYHMIKRLIKKEEEQNCSDLKKR